MDPQGPFPKTVQNLRARDIRWFASFPFRATTNHPKTHTHTTKKHPRKKKNKRNKKNTHRRQKKNSAWGSAEAGSCGPPPHGPTLCIEHVRRQDLWAPCRLFYLGTKRTPTMLKGPLEPKLSLKVIMAALIREHAIMDKQGMEFALAAALEAYNLDALGSSFSPAQMVLGKQPRTHAVVEDLCWSKSDPVFVGGVVPLCGERSFGSWFLRQTQQKPTKGTKAMLSRC